MTGVCTEKSNTQLISYTDSDVSSLCHYQKDPYLVRYMWINDKCSEYTDTHCVIYDIIYKIYNKWVCMYLYIYICM